jgi:hypothetical protein
MQELHNLSKRLEEELKVRIFQIAVQKTKDITIKIPMNGSLIFTLIWLQTGRFGNRKNSETPIISLFQNAGHYRRMFRNGKRNFQHRNTEIGSC